MADRLGRAVGYVSSYLFLQTQTTGLYYSTCSGTWEDCSSREGRDDGEATSDGACEGALDTAGALLGYRAPAAGKPESTARIDDEATGTRQERRRLAVTMRMRAVRIGGASLSTSKSTYLISRGCIVDLGFHGARRSVWPAPRRHVLLSVERAMDSSEER